MVSHNLGKIWTLLALLKTGVHYSLLELCTLISLKSKHGPLTTSCRNAFLVGGWTNPFNKKKCNRQIESFPQIKVNIKKNVWNHLSEMYLSTICAQPWCHYLVHGVPCETFNNLIKQQLCLCVALQVGVHNTWSVSSYSMLNARNPKNIGNLTWPNGTIFHQPGFPWSNLENFLSSVTFWWPRSCDVAII